ncbi:penicillin-insensitive murein endopeptidase [Pseudoalteromonas sp. SSDWG2]|uniref:penicillin-insensitive murein endopeptidase n=1 Tax=Pseudoalteromonas sp. SSDWG2 TaxID=3139391 RepID=UPI003BAC2B38
MKIFLSFLFLLSFFASATESICYGTTANGHLDNGVQLPSNGANFVGYSNIARLAGRTYEHSTVYQIVVDAYTALEVSRPEKVFQYAETGFENGGEFKPHKTHRNGLSVDFMVPVVDEGDKSVHLPTNPWNKFGYNIEFDGSGKFESYRIDYEAMAAHIFELDKAAEISGVKIWRVIFDPKLQPYLLKTKYGEYLKAHIRFSTKPSWVRHDEHYHIDFDVPCK